MKIGFGENIRRLRIERGMTQERLADFLGVSFQAVSKWERGDTVPDLYMLPVIASFFGVSADYLLGIDKNEEEKRIQQYIETYSELWSERKYEKVLKTMKEAVKNYPSEYGLLVRYLNALLWCAQMSAERMMSVKNEAQAVYERIIDHCTVDSIRIWAKKLMCKYYFRLSGMEGSGVCFDDAEEILGELPLMQNSRDYLSCSLSPNGEQKDFACKNAISEIAYLLSGIAREIVMSEETFGDEERKSMAEELLRVLCTIFPEGDFGKCYVNVACLMAELGRICAQAGDSAADEFFSMAMECAERFDNSPFEFKHTSPLVKGLELRKKDIPMAQNAPLAEMVKNSVAAE